MAEFLRRFADKLRRKNRISGIRITAESVESVPQIETDLVFWDLNDIEAAKTAQVRPGYYVEVKNVSGDQLDSPDLLNSYILPINELLWKMAPGTKSENTIRESSHNFYLDLNNAWNLTPWAYNPAKKALLVRADRYVHRAGR